MTFSGFPREALTFYDGLVADNSRIYWLANKQIFESSVRAPMRSLLDELEDYGPFHVFRPNKDVRFSKDKTPYKDHIGAYGESQGGAGHYVQLSATGLFVGSGYYQMASDQLQRFRDAVDGDAVGGQLVAIAADLASAGYDIGAISSLKTAPRGYPKDHPRIELLRRKGLIMSRQWKPAAWLHGTTVVSRIRDVWLAAAPMNSWLDTHVGPSMLAPDQDALARFGPL